MRARRLFLVLLLALVASVAFPSTALAQTAPVWTEADGEGGALVHLYFFHSRTCPHCREAMPFVEDLAATTPWLRLHSMEVSESKANAESYVAFASLVGEQAMYVPAFFYCGQMVAGYDNAEGVGAALQSALSACHEQAVAEVQARGAATAGAGASGGSEGAIAGAGVAAAGAAGQGRPVAEAAAAQADEQPLVQAAALQAPAETISVPLLGEMSVAALSLPALTVMIAGLDAFNPCAFFVLMFLLSLMVHAGSRRRMLLVGGVFVIFSALLYFVFMSAWLNVFLWLGELQFITLLAGLVAIALALINIKDFFWFKQGVSLSIPDKAKPGLFARARTTVAADSLWAVLGSTVLLALAANSYELLCTSGFPMVYTRALTLHDLPAGSYYGYLAAYNFIYVIPLLVIVTVFAAKFGARKLSEDEGRTLKLISGVMMLMLGVLLVLAPERLSNPLTAASLLAAALGVSFALVYVDRKRRPRRAPATKAGHRTRTPRGPHGASR